MSDLRFPFTEAIATIMKSWGWRSVGRNPALDMQWSKYEKNICVAKFADETWSRDVKAAHELTTALASPHTSTLKPRVIELMEGVGWERTMTSHDTWAWMKFNERGSCEGVQGGVEWDIDINACEIIAGVNDRPPQRPPEIWMATPELRYELAFPRGPSLQQKWVRQWPFPKAGQDEDELSKWRDVPTVDGQGIPFV